MSIFQAIAHPKEFLVNQFLNGILKGAGDGKYGAAVKAVYWWMHDHAVTVGAILAGVDGVLVALNCADCTTYHGYLTAAWGFLAASGLAVNLHAAEAPQK